MMEEGARCRDHSLYGLCLVKSALDTGDDELLFVAVNQVSFDPQVFSQQSASSTCLSNTIDQSGGSRRGSGYIRVCRHGQV
jgi:hypothetical protein